jgi:hypothetical protein
MQLFNSQASNLDFCHRHYYSIIRSEIFGKINPRMENSDNVSRALPLARGLEFVLPLLNDFLSFSSVIELALVNRSLHHSFLTNEEAWVQLLDSELGITTAEDPPGQNRGNSSSFHSSEQTARNCFRNWRTSFLGYSLEEVKLARLWWKRMEKWLSEHSPLILSTLREPPTSQMFADAEKRLERPIPRLLKLFYRFHDGQQLDFDQMVLGKPVHQSRFAIFQSIHCGLFGGYNFYDQKINVRFLPLEQMVQYSGLLPRQKLVPALPSWTDSTRWSSRHHGKEEFGANEYWEDRPKPCVFACNAIIEGLEKFFGCTEGSELMADGLVTNFGTFCLYWKFIHEY